MRALLPPAHKPIAFLSDVHGNLTALDAVLEEVREQDINQVMVAGDLLLGGQEPLQVWRRLTGIGARCVSGPSDVALISIDPSDLRPSTREEESKAAAFAEARAQIGDLVVEQLKRLPERLRFPLIDGGEVVMVHGSPRDASEGISHEMSDDEVLYQVDGDPADIVVCGGTHVPFERRI
ncbi:MAG: metallophosphoesterase family protein, partial [Myxococcota bacterium]